MSLPFLKARKIASVIMAKRKPTGEVEVDHSGDALNAASDDMIRAIEAKDSEALSHAFRSAMEILLSEEPTEESLDEEAE